MSRLRLVDPDPAQLPERIGRDLGNCAGRSAAEREAYISCFVREDLYMLRSAGFIQVNGTIEDIGECGPIRITRHGHKMIDVCARRYSPAEQEVRDVPGGMSVVE